MAKTVRAATEAPLILGGAAITLRPTQLLERLGASHAVIGEGEVAFRSVVDASRGANAPRRS